MDDKTYRVEVQSDFIQKLAHVAAVSGLAELVWNALDADATSVEIAIDEAVFGMERLIIRDNGTGLRHEDAPTLFSNLGNSWKRTRRTTKRDGRFMHGAEGQGRFKALSLGRVVSWHIVHAVGDQQFQQFEVWIAGDKPSEVHVSEVAILPSAKPGVVVTVSELLKGFGSLKGQAATQSLSEMFSSYLRSYPDVTIRAPSGALDPASTIAATKQLELPPVRYEDADYPATLELVSWKLPTERFLYFCDERGLSLGRVPLRIHAPGFNVSAHLKSKLAGR